MSTESDTPTPHVCDESCGVLPNAACPLWSEEEKERHRQLAEWRKQVDDEYQRAKRRETRQ